MKSVQRPTEPVARLSAAERGQDLAIFFLTKLRHDGTRLFSVDFSDAPYFSRLSSRLRASQHLREPRVCTRGAYTNFAHTLNVSELFQLQSSTLRRRQRAGEGPRHQQLLTRVRKGGRRGHLRRCAVAAAARPLSPIKRPSPRWPLPFVVRCSQARAADARS